MVESGSLELVLFPCRDRDLAPDEDLGLARPLGTVLDAGSHRMASYSRGSWGQAVTHTVLVDGASLGI